MTHQKYYFFFCKMNIKMNLSTNFVSGQEIEQNIAQHIL